MSMTQGSSKNDERNLPSLQAYLDKKSKYAISGWKVDYLHDSLGFANYRMACFPIIENET